MAKLTAHTYRPQLSILCISLAALTRAFSAIHRCRDWMYSTAANLHTCFIQATLDELPQISYVCPRGLAA
jgi:hypothetical protein